MAASLIRNLRETKNPDLIGDPRGIHKAWTFEVLVWPVKDAGDKYVKLLLRQTKESLLEAGAAVRAPGWAPLFRAWEAYLLGDSRYRGSRVGPPITGDGLTIAVGDLATRKGAEAAEVAGQAAVHGVIESVTFSTTTPESVEHGDFEETGFEVEPIVVSPTYVHQDAGQYYTYDAEGSDWFSSSWETTDYRTGEAIQRSLHLSDLNSVSLASFSDWDQRPYPLLYGDARERETLERAAMELMASRGYYSFAYDAYGGDLPAEQVGAIADATGFGHLYSPIDYEEYWVFESRNAKELLVFQDVLLSKGIEGAAWIEVPRSPSGGIRWHTGFERIGFKEPGASEADRLFLLKQVLSNPAFGAVRETYKKETARLNPKRRKRVNKKLASILRKALR